MPENGMRVAEAASPAGAARVAPFDWRPRPRGARGEGEKKGRRRPTLARASPALPSAMGPLTSVFGMGTGMAAPPWPPAKRPELETKGNRDPRRDARPISRSSEAEKAKPHAILVPVSSTDRSACTPGLSRSWSTTWLERLASGKACLRGGLALRCFQRLSVPCIATRPAAGATTGTPWARHPRSSRTRECSRQTTCAHRG